MGMIWGGVRDQGVEMGMFRYVFRVLQWGPSQLFCKKTRPHVYYYL